MQKIDKKDWILLGIILVVALIGAVLFFYKQGELMVDVGREFYLSKEVALGKILYKDIFNIYGPLSYQINAILFKIFGFHTNVPVVAGNLCGLAISVCTYILSRQFLARLYSFLVSLFIVFIGIYNDWIFSFTVPYSYAMLYGLLALLISFIFLIKYVRNNEKSIYLYWSLFFAGTLTVLKYDYIPYLLVFPIVMFFAKTNVKTVLKSLCCFAAVPLVSFGALFAEGLTISDVLFNIALIKKVSAAPSLYFFYKRMHVLFSLRDFILTLVNLTLCGFVFCLIYKILDRIKSKWAYMLVSAIGVILLFDEALIKKFSFLSILIVVLVLCLHKKITDKSHWLLIAVALSLSIKEFLWTNFFTYGLYSFPIQFLCCIVLLKTYIFKNEKAFKSSLIFFLIFIIVPFLKFRFENGQYYDVEVKTEHGMLLTTRELSTVKLLVEVLQKNVKKDDTLVVLPEGHIINFLTGTKSDDFYSNFIPMYVEAFGEQNIINHYSKNMPDYFVLSTRNTSEYGAEGICKDYALGLCDWIFNNYHVTAKIVGEPQYVILRKN